MEPSYRAKMKWAKHHIVYLADAIREDEKAGRFRPEVEQEAGGRWRLTYAFPEEMRIRYALIAGDAVASLRATLDHLVYALADGQGRTQFPICLIAADFKQQAHMIAGIHDDAAAFIQKMQPYHAGAEARTHPLWILGSMANRDKHRILEIAEFELTGERQRVIPKGQRQSPDYSGIHEGYTSTGILRDGTVRHIPAPPPGMEIEFQTAITVAFGLDGPVPRRRVIPVLEDLGSLVEKIVTTLEPYVPAAHVSSS